MVCHEPWTTTTRQAWPRFRRVPSCARSATSPPHAGMAGRIGRADQALERLMAVNGLSRENAEGVLRLRLTSWIASRRWPLWCSRLVRRSQQGHETLDVQPAGRLALSAPAYSARRSSAERPPIASIMGNMIGASCDVALATCLSTPPSSWAPSPSEPPLPAARSVSRARPTSTLA